MTREEWTKLTPVEQRIKVAELCGHITKEDAYKARKYLTYDMIGCYAIIEDHVPDYLNDLNAMHEAVETLRSLDGPQWHDFEAHLRESCGSVMNCINATAVQRAEAFVLTMEEQ